jgi:hypothetical protein
MTQHTEELDAAHYEANRLEARLRHVAQILIAEIGANGPTNAEEAAFRAVEIIRAHRALQVEPDPIRAIAESMAGSLTGVKVEAQP